MNLDEYRLASGALWAHDDAAASIRRVWVAIPLVGALVAAMAPALGSWRDAAGVVAGVALAMVNFRFLHGSLRGILESGQKRAPSGTTLMFVFRWIIVATIAFALYRTAAVTLVGTFVGLFVPAIAVSLEALFQTMHALRSELHDDAK